MAGSWRPLAGLIMLLLSACHPHSGRELVRQTEPARVPPELVDAPPHPVSAYARGVASAEPTPPKPPAVPANPPAPQRIEAKTTPPSGAHQPPVTIPDLAAPTHPLLQALSAFLDDRPDKAVAHLQAYDPKDQELLLRLLPIAARVEKGGVLSSRLSNEEKLALLEVVLALADDLRQAAPLVMPKVAFCKRVFGFGKYEPLAANQFRPGEVAKVYVELQNLSDHQRQHEYHTTLAGAVEIRGPDGKLVQPYSFPARADRSHSLRHDHYVVFQVPIPADLVAGFYTLRVRVADPETRREVEKSLSFRVSTLTAAAGQ